MPLQNTSIFFVFPPPGGSAHVAVHPGSHVKMTVPGRQEIPRPISWALYMFKKNLPYPRGGRRSLFVVCSLIYPWLLACGGIIISHYIS